jgi:LmbE family N-acetylglucosaminyl deacetylase
MSRWGSEARSRNTRPKASKPFSSPPRAARAGATAGTAPATGTIRDRRSSEKSGWEGCAAAALGIRELSLLDYRDGGLDRANPAEAVGRIAEHLRRARPDVVVTFGPDGAYGHPDHIAISQFTTAAIVQAASPSAAPSGCRPHVVSKLYYLAWPESTWTAYQQALKKLTAKVDGVERQAVPWPDWAITTAIDTRLFWPAVWRAVSCHELQIGGYERLAQLRPEHQEALWGRQWFYRVFSTVNGGRGRETDLLEGLDASRDSS